MKYLKNYHISLSILVALILGIFILFFKKNSASISRTTIYIYRDEGVAGECFDQTYRIFCNFSSAKYKTEKINAEKVLQGEWTKNAALFILPGGRATPYSQKLGDRGNTIIREYVNKGGAFLGICAGGYYGSSRVEFDNGGPLEIIRTTELLNFFPGAAIGPVFQRFQYQNNNGAYAAEVSAWLQGNEQKMHLYLNGGSYYNIGEPNPRISVLARYGNDENLRLGRNQAAIIHISYGSGNVILSGVHFEYDEAFLKSEEDPCLEKILPKLNASSALRKNLIREIFKKLKIEIKGLAPLPHLS